MFWFRARFSDVEIDLFFHFFLNDPAISQIILDEEELKAKQVCFFCNFFFRKNCFIWLYNFFKLSHCLPFFPSFFLICNFIFCPIISISIVNFFLFFHFCSISFNFILFSNFVNISIVCIHFFPFVHFYSSF